MHIGINASFLRKPGTGIGQVTLNFLRKVTELQNDHPDLSAHRFFVYVEEHPELAFELPENFQIRSFLPWWKRDDVPRKWLWERALAEKAREDGCDVFLSLYQSATVFKSDKPQTPNFKRFRHTMIVHDLIPFLFPEYANTVSRRLYVRAMAKGIRHADALVAMSECTKNDLVKVMHISPEAITVVYQDVHPRFRETVSEEQQNRVLEKYALKPGYLYHGGGLEIRKNGESVLRAYKQLVTDDQEGKHTPPLVISGTLFHPSNTLATDVEGLIEEMGLDGKVKTLGFVADEDLPALYRGALCFLFPSRYEGFGLPVLEALCQDVPVLTSALSSLPEVGGDAVLYVDPKSVTSVREGIKRLMTDPVLRERLVALGKMQREKFSWNAFIEKILKQAHIIF